ncbi:aminotransferase class IV [Henriciella sp.]|uniref:aminotransferase class IV n=1 Tax=Henriciella sp. TaxID=1968823 RepID=UPI00262E786E|nr:aminotransferase class IV [Henriciella sp.]
MIRIRQFDTGTESTRQSFDLTDRGLLLGDGVFDTSMVRNGQIILMEDHLSRLAGDCDALGIQIEVQELRAFAMEAVPTGGNGALRLTVTRGPGPRGLSPGAFGPATLISKFDAGNPAFPAVPARIMTSDIHRNPSAPSSRHKTLAYTDTVIGMERAKSAGYDDALYLAPDGHVTCSSIANIFARFGNELVTPPLEDGVLKGVMRGWLLAKAAEAGLQARVASLQSKDLRKADALYLTNSLQLVRAVSTLDDMRFDTEIPSRLHDMCASLAGLPA